MSHLRNAQQLRGLAAAGAVMVLGFALCSAVIAGMTAGAAQRRVVLASLDDGEEKALHIDNVLAARDVDMFHDAPLPGPGEREGFENQDAFMRAHEGTQIGIAKQLDQEEKFDVGSLGGADRDELLDRNDDNAHQLSAFLAKQDADAKRDMDQVLGDWEDHRQSLQDQVDYEDKMNGVLNQNADRMGEMLERHTKETTEAAEDVADQEERANEVQLKKFTAGLERRQEDLASQIVGLPDPSEPSDDEKALLKQNIMSEESLKEFE